MALVFISECLAVFAFTPVVPNMTIAALAPFTQNAQGQIVIPANTALGTAIAQITVTMSDGSNFGAAPAGTLAFGSPNFGDIDPGTGLPIYMLVNVDPTHWNIAINNQVGAPGVGGQGGTLDNITVVATK